MDLLLETTSVLLVAILGVTLGIIFARLKKPYWLFGYFLPLSLITTLVIIRYININILDLLPISFWMVTGELRLATLAFAITMGLTTSLLHLPRKSEKVIACILMVVLVARFSVSPFIAPDLLKNDLSNLKTTIDPNGICYQSRNYTCGPAAAVTALNKLGFDAEEGEIAILARSSPTTGTLPEHLYATLQNLYGYKGLRCQYRHFDSIAQLKGKGITLAVIKDTFLTNHCVVVMEVSDQTVVIADPVFGKLNMSHEQFEKIWRFSGIVLKRDPSQSI